VLRVPLGLGITIVVVVIVINAICIIICSRRSGGTGSSTLEHRGNNRLCRIHQLETPIVGPQPRPRLGTVLIVVVVRTCV
jgi:hypothetical protein